jgi:transposase
MAALDCRVNMKKLAAAACWNTGRTRYLGSVGLKKQKEEEQQQLRQRLRQRQRQRQRQDCAIKSRSADSQSLKL